MGITEWFCIPHFKPTIDFNMLQYINSNDLQVSNPLQVFKYFNDLPAGLLVILITPISWKDQSILYMPFSNEHYALIKGRIPGYSPLIMSSAVH